MRGRKPHTTRRRALEGNPGHRPLNTDEPKFGTPPDAFDEPPLEVAKHVGAAAAWRELAPMLRVARVITTGDRQALVALCIQWGLYTEAIEKLHERGLIVLTPQGFPIQNPYLAIANKALQACLRLWPELGLTPSSRTRVSAPTEPAADPFAEFDAPTPPHKAH